VNTRNNIFRHETLCNSVRCSRRFEVITIARKVGNHCANDMAIFSKRLEFQEHRCVNVRPRMKMQGVVKII
jgi:hypothetical protein